MRTGYSNTSEGWVNGTKVQVTYPTGTLTKMLNQRILVELLVNSSDVTLWGCGYNLWWDMTGCSRFKGEAVVSRQPKSHCQSHV